MKTFWIIVAFLALFSLIGILTDRAARRRLSEKMNRMFSELDQAYIAYVEGTVTLNVLKNESLQMDSARLTEDILAVLKPSIDGLLALIKSSGAPSAHVTHQSLAFSGSIAVAESLVGRLKKNKSKKLSSADELEFMQSFKDAIMADLKKRELSLQTGSVL